MPGLFQRVVVDERTHRANVFYTYRFGRELLSHANTWLSFLDQEGTFPYRNMLARERVVLHHSPSLQTDYAVTYQETDVGFWMQAPGGTVA